MGLVEKDVLAGTLKELYRTSVNLDDLSYPLFGEVRRRKERRGGRGEGETREEGEG